MKTRTKIICTLGPSTNTYEAICSLIDAGMNVARINFSHGTQADHKKTFDMLKKARTEKGVPLAIMLDNKGPEIRVGVLDEPISVKRDQELLLVSDESPSGNGLPINPGIALDALKVGDFVLFDDGYIGSEVTAVSKGGVTVKFLNHGTIKSRKGVNMPHVDVPLPALTEQDISDIKFGCSEDVDIIAASFIRSAEHVREIKALLYEQGKSDILVISKIENGLGVENFDSILQISDGIMVARGDLGVELPIQEVPVLQKMMIRKCVQAAKPVVTATQMLESMIDNPRPTRAESSDVANAIYDSTSAVMLSGETAVGKYPIQTVNLMRQIVESAEHDFHYEDFFYRDSRIDSHDVSTSIALASVKTAYSLGAHAIFAYTSSGSTARIISRFRPEMPIVALSSNEKTYHQLGFNWGVIPVPPQEVHSSHEALRIVSQFAREHELVHFGDLVVVTAGTPFGLAGSTNTLVVESIGEVLVRGHPSEGAKTDGRIKIILSSDTYAIRAATGKIVVLSKFDETMKPIVKKAKGIILQNHPEDVDSEHLAIDVAKDLEIPLIVRADEALRRLSDGQTVTMDPQQGIVYKKLSSHHSEESLGISDPKD